MAIIFQTQFANGELRHGEFQQQRRGFGGGRSTLVASVGGLDVLGLPPPKAGDPAWKTGPHKRVIVPPLIHGDGDLHGPHGLIADTVRVAKVDQAPGVSLAGIVTLDGDVVNSCSTVVTPIRANKGAPCVAVYGVSPPKGPLGRSPLFRCGVTAAKVLYENDVGCSVAIAGRA